MFALNFIACVALLLFAAPVSAGERRVSEDRDLKEIDLSGWDCRDELGGSAKTEDGVKRNRGKNRSPINFDGLAIPSFDTASFLKMLGSFTAQTQWLRRKDLDGPQQTQLSALEKQVVSFTGYLVLAYAGPPESTNCASVDFHDWHLEVFQEPADHPPRVGDPTPIICEITPRTQNAIYRAGIRLQDLAAYIRRPDLTYEPTGHPPRQIRLTGYLLCDDEHNGRADVGPTISSVSENGFHHPWRSTAWEMHPIIKIEPLTTSGQRMSAVTAAPSAPPVPAVAASPPPAPPLVTILEPVTIKIPYGETVLPRGMKLPLLSRTPETVTVRYLDGPITLPLRSTDLP